MTRPNRPRLCARPRCWPSCPQPGSGYTCLGRKTFSNQLVGWSVGWLVGCLVGWGWLPLMKIICVTLRQDKFFSEVRAAICHPPLEQISKEKKNDNNKKKSCVFPASLRTRARLCVTIRPHIPHPAPDHPHLPPAQAQARAAATEGLPGQEPARCVRVR